MSNRVLVKCLLTLECQEEDLEFVTNNIKETYVSLKSCAYKNIEVINYILVPEPVTIKVTKLPEDFQNKCSMLELKILTGFIKSNDIHAVVKDLLEDDMFQFHTQGSLISYIMMLVQKGYLSVEDNT